MKHYKTILVGLDGSTNSLSALEKAGELALSELVEPSSPTKIVLQMKHYKTILVGLDGSTNSLSALEKAGELAQLMDAKLVLVTVVKPELQVGFGGPGLEVNTLSAKQLEAKQEQAKKMLTQYQTKLPDQVKQQAMVVLGDPKVMLSENLPKKYQAELVIVGATGLNKLDRFILGSTAAYVVRNTKVDTLVVNE